MYYIIVYNQQERNNHGSYTVHYYIYYSFIHHYNHPEYISIPSVPNVICIYIYILYIYMELIYGFICILLQCEAPKIAKLVYNSNNYGLWYL